MKMNTHIFVPITDEMIYNHPEAITAPIVPYFAGMTCEHWLEVEINPDETSPSSKALAIKPASKTKIIAQSKPRSAQRQLALNL